MISTSEFWSVLTQALGWTIMHSLWQIGLIYLIFKSFSWIYQRYNRIGYACALIAMAAAITWSVITFSNEYRRIQAMFILQADMPTSGISENDMAEFPASAVFSDRFSGDADWKTTLLNWLEEQSALFGWIWFFCVVALFLRLLGGYWLTRRLRYRGTSAPERPFEDLCRQWSARLGIRREVQLLESKYITEPLTLGFWKPVILFPAGMLLHLTTVQVEALLLHELAHVRRYDYLVNLIQLSLDTFFFYHPLFWLISREARRRREYSCDDTVMRFTQDRLEYARTLTEIKLHPVHLQNQFAMTSIGKDNFSIRILRIAGMDVQRSGRSGLILPALLLMGIITIVGLPLMTQAATPEIPAAQPDLTLESKNKTTTPPQIAKSAAVSVVSGKTNPPPDAQTPPVKPAPDSLAPAGPVAIELNKMNVCYIGIDNPVQIAVDGVPSAELVVRIKGDGAISGGNGQYIARFSQPGNAHIEVFRRKTGKETLLTSREYRIKRIPDPVPELCGKTGGVISVESLLHCTAVDAMLVNFDFDAGCEVIGFECTILPKDSDPIAVNAVGNKIPESMQEIIKKLTPGAAIFFDDIKVKCSGDQAARNIGAMAFKVR